MRQVDPQRRGSSGRQRKDRMTIDNPNTIKVLITGGGGFLGSRLARTILQRGHLSGRPIAELVLADLVPPPPDLARDERVRAATGALIDQAKTLGQENFDLVFHLAAAVSAECEANLDLGLRSNVDTTRALLDALRAEGAAAFCLLQFSGCLRRRRGPAHAPCHPRRHLACAPVVVWSAEIYLRTTGGGLYPSRLD